MNKFELFTMIYFALDAYYKDAINKDEDIRCLLSDMNPFVWKDCCSADPAVYNEFCRFVGEKQVTIDNSLEIAMEYVNTIKQVDVKEAICNMEEEWFPACREYLASDHKGKD